MSLFRALLERRRLPGPLTAYVQGVACFYLVFGLSTIAWPGQMQVVFQARPFVGDEESLFRVLGMTVAVIGWLHLFAGRDASRPVIAATVIDRLLVPWCSSRSRTPGCSPSCSQSSPCSIRSSR